MQGLESGLTKCPACAGAVLGPAGGAPCSGNGVYGERSDQISGPFRTDCQRRDTKEDWDSQSQRQGQTPAAPGRRRLPVVTPVSVHSACHPGWLPAEGLSPLPALGVCSSG